MPSSQSYRFRRGTAAQWTAANPVLAAGEGGYATDAGVFKIGNGTTAWSSLPSGIKPGLYKTAADYNIPTDGTSDCTTALNAIPANVGEVLLIGTFNVTGPINIQTGVTLRGAGPRSNTRIVAASGFSGTHLINLGGGATAHGSRVEHMAIECNGRVATAIKGDDIQELSGVKDCVVSGFTAVGMNFSGTGTSQNYVIESVEVYAQTAAANIVGIRTKAGAVVQNISNVTVILGTLGQAAAAGSVGLELNGPVGLAQGLHFESTQVGVKLNGATGSIVSGVTGVGSTQIVTDLVQVVNTAQDNITLSGLFTNGSTKSLNDLLHGYSYAGNLSLYAWSGGGTSADTVLNIGDPTRQQRFYRVDTFADIYARLGATGQVYLGDGVVAWGSAFDTELRRTAASVLSMGADDVLKTGQNVTASRPSASTVGAGAQFYDTTLGKPIWSNGTVWKDAAGTTV